MQKLFLLVVLFTLITFLAAAQRNSFGLTPGIGKGFIAQEALEETPVLELNRPLSIVIQYDRIFSDKYTFETGLKGYKNQISVTPAFYPGVDMTPVNYEIQLVYVPLFLKVNSLKFFLYMGFSLPTLIFLTTVTYPVRLAVVMV